MENFEKIMAECRALADLHPRHIEILKEHARTVSFKPQEFIHRKGENADEFYIITKGKVALEVYSARRGPLIVQTISEGEILGWSWLIPPCDWRVNAHAVEQTEVIQFDGKALRERCENDPELGYQLLKRFARIADRRLEATMLQLIDIYGDHA